LAFFYWIDNLGFVTEGKLAAIFNKPSLGVFNWPVIYFINYMPISSLALFNTASPPTNIHIPWRSAFFSFLELDYNGLTSSLAKLMTSR
jgi:hypothetical protein